MFSFLRRRPSDPESPKSYRIKGIRIDVVDVSTSIAPLIVHEIKKGYYGFDRMRFRPDDVVIDVGGHIGIVSMYLAKKFPYIQIYAYEPVPLNYEFFLENIKRNGINNIRLSNVAVTSDRRDVRLAIYRSNTGGATSNLPDMELAGYEYYDVKSITLDDIFDQNGIDRCKLLKIDCEGSEHEILKTTTKLGRIEWISGEFHINSHLEAQGHSIEGLVDHLRGHIPSDHIVFEPCRMAETAQEYVDKNIEIPVAPSKWTVDGGRRRLS